MEPKFRTNSQKYIYGKMKKDIEEGIKKYSNIVQAIERIKLYPKKDGKEKANFALNFGLDIGETYTIKWGGTNGEEKRRYVHIALESNYNNKVNSVKFSISPIWEGEGENRKQILEFTEHSIWFNCEKYKKGLEDHSAKGILELIKGPYLEDMKENLNRYKKDLEQLPTIFEKMVEAANNLQKFINSTADNAVIHRYAYELQGKENYNFVDINK